MLGEIAFLIPLIPALTLWEGKLIITTTKQSASLHPCQIIINSSSGSESAISAAPQICFPPVSVSAEHRGMNPWNNSNPLLTCKGGVAAQTNGPIKAARGQQIYVGIQGHGRRDTCASPLMQRRRSSLGQSASRMGLHQGECIRVRWRAVRRGRGGPLPLITLRRPRRSPAEATSWRLMCSAESKQSSLKKNALTRAALLKALRVRFGGT